MSIVSGDLKFFQSDLEGSSGGVISLIEIPQRKMELIFRDTPRDFLVDGGIVYKKIFLVNTNQDFALLSAKAYVLHQPQNGERIALAIGTDSDIDPSSLSFDYYNDSSDSLSLGDVSSNEVIPLWLRRLTPPETREFEGKTMFQLAVRGQTD